MSPTIVRVLRLSAAVVFGVSALVLTGCQTDYAADITNKTPQPVFAQIFAKRDNGAVLGASKRLGPGDRLLVGPVRNDKNKGAFISVDTLPNPGRPITADLVPGTAFLEVQQDGEGTAGPIRIVEKP